MAQGSNKEKKILGQVGPAPEQIIGESEDDLLDYTELIDPVPGVTVTSVVLLVLLIASSIFLLGITNFDVVKDAIPSGSLTLLLRVGVILLIVVYIAYLVFRERIHNKYQEKVIEALNSLSLRLGTILKVARRLGAQLDFDDLLRDIVNEALPVTRASLGAVYIMQRDLKNMQLRYASGVDMGKMMFKEIPLVEGILADAASRKGVVTVDDLRSVDDRENLFFGAAAPGSQAVVPLWAGEKLKGMLVVASMEPHAYSEREIGMLSSVADVAGMALTNAELYGIASRSIDALMRRRELSEAILQEMKAGVMTADSEGKITLFNKEAERMTGFSFSEKVGRKLNPEQSPMVNPLGPIEAGMLEAMGSGSPVVRGKAFVLNSRNLSLPVSYSCYSIADDSGGIAGSAAVFMEIQGGAIQMPEDLGGGGKVLLNSLMARVEKLYVRPLVAVLERSRKMDPKAWMESQVELLDILDAGYGTLSDLMSDVQDYSAIDEVTEGEREESIDLRELVGGVVQELLARAGYRDIDVRMELSDIPQAFGYSRLAAEAIEKVLENSLSAAVKDDGRVEITGSVRDGTVVLAIHDFGRGVPKEMEDFIFAPFFTTSDSGSGLGLPIAARAMRNLGGRVWFENSPESGAVFYLEFPVGGSD